MSYYSSENKHYRKRSYGKNNRFENTAAQSLSLSYLTKWPLLEKQNKIWIVFPENLNEFTNDLMSFPMIHPIIIILIISKDDK